VLRHHPAIIYEGKWTNLYYTNFASNIHFFKKNLIELRRMYDEKSMTFRRYNHRIHNLTLLYISYTDLKSVYELSHFTTALYRLYLRCCCFVVFKTYLLCMNFSITNLASTECYLI